MKTRKDQGPKNLEAKELIIELEKKGRKEKRAVWKAVAEKLKRPRRKRIQMNLWKVDAMAKKFSGKTLLVPGKVLGSGEIGVKAKVCAFDFSQKAIDKSGVKGKALSINQLLEENEKPENIVIIG